MGSDVRRLSSRKRHFTYNLLVMGCEVLMLILPGRKQGAVTYILLVIKRDMMRLPGRGKSTVTYILCQWVMWWDMIHWIYCRQKGLSLTCCSTGQRWDQIAWDKKGIVLLTNCGIGCDNIAWKFHYYSHKLFVMQLGCFRTMGTVTHKLFVMAWNEMRQPSRKSLLLTPCLQCN